MRGALAFALAFAGWLVIDYFLPHEPFSVESFGLFVGVSLIVAGNIMFWDAKP